MRRRELSVPRNGSGKPNVPAILRNFSLPLRFVDQDLMPNVSKLVRGRSMYELPFGYHSRFGVGEDAPKPWRGGLASRRRRGSCVHKCRDIGRTALWDRAYGGE